MRIESQNGGLTPESARDRARAAPSSAQASTATRARGRGRVLPRGGHVDAARLEQGLFRARRALFALQQSEGPWCFELEADVTIPAEYVLMMHFTGEVEHELAQKLARYLRRHQLEDGGWPLYAEGAAELSCTVKAYWALKLAGDSIEAAHMRRARSWILERGGAARCNAFTRYALAMFGELDWRAVPHLPVEMLLLPRFSPFHLQKVSYWSRAVMVPLAVLCTLRARAVNPTGLGLRELFAAEPPRASGAQSGSPLQRIFLCAERTARSLDPLIPSPVRRRALHMAEQWILERLNGEGGLGAIFPAMVNAYEALLWLGHAREEPELRAAKRALERLVVERADEAYCQPCVSPVWDTALTLLALQEGARPSGAADGPEERALRRAHVWLLRNQVRSGPADWREARPHLEPGGWAFQYQNPHYPDLDDTSAVVWALHAADPERFREPIERAVAWFAGMQSENGGFGSFDADNTRTYLNEIPFADHGALLDPPTADVTGRCVAVLGMLGDARRAAPLARALEFLAREQEPDGSWFGRWGTNYVYGTWSVLSALEWVSADARERAGLGAECVLRAVRWLESVQRDDGGWGESCDSYAERSWAGRARASTPHQTAWAVLALCAAGRAHGAAVQAGVEWLLEHRSRAATGATRASTRRASRASSTCATTGTRATSRPGRSRATGASARAHERRAARRRDRVRPLARARARGPRGAPRRRRSRASARGPRAPGQRSLARLRRTGTGGRRARRGPARRARPARARLLRLRRRPRARARGRRARAAGLGRRARRPRARHDRPGLARALRGRRGRRGPRAARAARAARGERDPGDARGQARGLRRLGSRRRRPRERRAGAAGARARPRLPRRARGVRSGRSRAAPGRQRRDRRARALRARPLPGRLRDSARGRATLAARLARRARGGSRAGGRAGRRGAALGVR